MLLAQFCMQRPLAAMIWSQLKHNEVMHVCSFSAQKAWWELVYAFVLGISHTQEIIFVLKLSEEVWRNLSFMIIRMGLFQWDTTYVEKMSLPKKTPGQPSAKKTLYVCRGL